MAVANASPPDLPKCQMSVYMPKGPELSPLMSTLKLEAQIFGLSLWVHQPRQISHPHPDSEGARVKSRPPEGQMGRMQWPSPV